MSLSISDQKKLWGRASGRCSFANCQEDLIIDKTKLDPSIVIGEMAHIVASSNKGPRGKVLPIDRSQRDTYENSILLCEKHHKIVDGQRKTYPIGVLMQMKEDHEYLVADNHYFKRKNKNVIKWVTLIHQAQKVIDKKLVIQALKPDLPYQKTIGLNIDPLSVGWNKAKYIQELKLQRILKRIPSEHLRLAIFSLTHIPLAIHLGYLINDRYRVRLYDYHRDYSSWKWPLEEIMDKKKIIKIGGIPRKKSKASRPVIIRCSISAEVSERLTSAVVAEAVANVHIHVEKPAINAIKYYSQILELGVKFREVLDIIRTTVPKCTGIHMFYAGPCSGAVNIGRQINATINAPIYLYQYNMQDQPMHRHVLTLNNKQGGII